VDLGVALVAGSQASEVVQVSEAALDDPALAPEPRPVRAGAAGDDRCDAECSKQPPVLVVVIASIGEESIGLPARASELAGDRTAVEVFEQRDQLGDVVAVAAGEADRQRDATGVDQQMML
jgi:hypothetical protein